MAASPSWDRAQQQGFHSGLAAIAGVRISSPAQLIISKWEHKAVHAPSFLLLICQSCIPGESPFFSSGRGTSTLCPERIGIAHQRSPHPLGSFQAKEPAGAEQYSTSAPDLAVSPFGKFSWLQARTESVPSSVLAQPCISFPQDKLSGPEPSMLFLTRCIYLFWNP